MSNNRLGRWHTITNSPPSSTSYDVQPPSAPSHIAPSSEHLRGSPTQTTTPPSDSESVTSVVAVSNAKHHHVNVQGPSSTVVSSSVAISSLSRTTKKKKKSKMHECEICGKKFPRPSGLRTHMNTHNNAKPFPCGFPGCQRTFGVRSNAKRHLRTHGVIPQPSIPAGDTSYVVGFSTPVVMPPVDCSSRDDPDQPRHQTGRAPVFKLRWMPPSLTSRTNAGSLKSISDDGGSESDDEDDGANQVLTTSGPRRASSVLTMPLPAVIPTSPSSPSNSSVSLRSSVGYLESDHNQAGHYEERNSYMDTGSHPYHSSQVSLSDYPTTD
ncbi:hypothetical protein BDQ12DRAFT_606755 [Crucibulum laeve]|uniref:C2H2-type domain-containing protein n=1 Tax=Crucibulum laeve TaxID=68775 RepID=A0A5C3M037_9AGAR|nr:hypothetical protein BDQ12DRAFT_606755 [Crucibulum laeve]